MDTKVNENKCKNKEIVNWYEKNGKQIVKIINDKCVQLNIVTFFQEMRKNV